MPSRWRDEIGIAPKFALDATSSFKPLKPWRRKVGKVGLSGLAPRLVRSLRAKRQPFEVPGRRFGLGTAGWNGRGLRTEAEPPTEPAPARAPGDTEAAIEILARAFQAASRRQASSALRGPHAGESGVGRKAGPISLWGRRATAGPRPAPSPARRLGIICTPARTDPVIMVNGSRLSAVKGRIETSTG